MQNFFSAKENVFNYIAASKKRVENDPVRIIILSIFAGIFISFGAAGSSLAAHNIVTAGVGKIITGLVFPVGLMMVILTGAELFTGDCMFIMGVAEKRYKFISMLKILVLVYAGNMAGSILMAILITMSGQLDVSQGLLGAYTIKIAAAKTSIPFASALISGILCNVLVCTAVFMAGCAKDITGKLFSAFFPIMLFVICGFEHCVANMYFIPAGIMAAKNHTYVNLAMQNYGLSMEQISTVNWSNFFTQNLIPVTIGNIVGGIVFFAMPILMAYREGRGNRECAKEEFSLINEGE